jgi:Ras-related protein Rab-6A
MMSLVLETLILGRSSFESVTKWTDDVKSERGNDIILVLVGNKTDLTEKRQISTEEGEAKAKELGCIFMETSAKAGYNVKALFNRIAEELPGVEGGQSQAPPSQLIDIRLNPSQSTSNASKCAC